jgi:hypothetical protein
MRLSTGRSWERVAVGRRPRDLRRPGDAADAAVILDDEGLAELRRKPLGGEPRHHVGVAARDERHDDRHRPGRPVEAIRRQCRAITASVATARTEPLVGRERHGEVRR